jgi:AraC family transcriptional activator of pobA
MGNEKINIPHFGLYGEDALTPELGYVHLEDIETRSSDAGWFIQPHRHGQLFQILCMYNGQADVQLDSERHQLKDGWAITIPAGSVHGFRFSPGTKGTVLTIAEPLLKDENYSESKHLFESLFSSPQTIQLSSDKFNLHDIERFINLISIELQQTNTGQTKMLEWLVRATLLVLLRQNESNKSNQTAEPSYSQLIVKFRHLLDQHYREHWPVSQYAKAMNISPTTLNRVCNITTKQSAKIIVGQRIAMEAKRKLIYTREHLDQIAYHLGFKDPGYFSRFFKKHEGVAPSKYRQDKQREL